MVHSFFREANITDVAQIVEEHQNWATIKFRLNETPFELYVPNREDRFSPCTVSHESNQRCCMCQGVNGLWRKCDAFQPHLHDLFHRLIEHPSIRLEWLFLSAIGGAKDEKH